MIHLDLLVLQQFYFDNEYHIFTCRASLCFLQNHTPSLARELMKCPTVVPEIGHIQHLFSVQQLTFRKAAPRYHQHHDEDGLSVQLDTAGILQRDFA